MIDNQQADLVFTAKCHQLQQQTALNHAPKYVSGSSQCTPFVFRADRILQTMVYKLVPGLFSHEMRMRRDFYDMKPYAGMSFWSYF